MLPGVRQAGLGQIVYYVFPRIEGLEHLSAQTLAAVVISIDKGRRLPNLQAFLPRGGLWFAEAVPYSTDRKPGTWHGPEETW